MKLYLDTSLLVSLFVREQRTSEVQAWFAQVSGRDLVVSDWVITEFESALALKARMAQIGDETRAIVGTLWRAALTGPIAIIPVSRSHFILASRLVADERSGLRSADALHLAIAHGHDATVCMLDRKLAQGADHHGISARLV